MPAAFGSPAIMAGRHREGSDGKMNRALRDGVGRRGSGKRKSQIIEEEEEDGEGTLREEDEEEEIEEVETFPAIELNKGEKVESITIWNEGVEDPDGMESPMTVHP